MKENKLLNQIDKIDGEKVVDGIFNVGRWIKQACIFILTFLASWLVVDTGGAPFLLPVLFGYIVILNISRQIIRHFLKKGNSLLEGYDESLGLKLDLLLALAGIIITAVIQYIVSDGKIFRTIGLTLVSSAISIFVCIRYKFIELKHLKLLIYVLVNIATFIVVNFFVIVLIDEFVKTALIAGAIILLIYGLFCAPDAEIHHSNGTVSKVYKR